MPNGWNAHPARTSALLLLERGRDARPVASALEDGGWTVTLAESAAAAMQLATANDYGLLRGGRRDRGASWKSSPGR